ncbi:Survival motor neuron [Penicillium brevicompactum]|uniref:Survival motor neuron n=1 Tax=Penicillium brevicompactum TaxID=5074 RepID=A0A9W9U7X9_PENBR|nr:Survival motor neuron [Penicillium brevicompactum]
MGKKKNVSMTHEEIWDDSALMQSWDDAVEEYQQYHSIHAKGENVEEVLKAAEESGSVVEGESLEESVDDPGEDDATNVESEDVAMVIDETTSETAAQTSQPVSAPSAEVPAAALPMPLPLMANVKNEAMKNLMMSWYYAGYYTGLHEGQQQASQGKNQ